MACLIMRLVLLQQLLLGVRGGILQHEVVNVVNVVNEAAPVRPLRGVDNTTRGVSQGCVLRSREAWSVGSTFCCQPNDQD